MKQLFLFIAMNLLWIPLTFCQPIIKVWGTEDPLSVKQQVTAYLALLDIQEPVHLSVGFTTHMPSKQKGLTICINSPEDKGYQVIRIKIDARLSQTEKNLVLAHELVHAKQYVKGELIVSRDQQVTWKGRKYGNRYTDYLRTPWENEAYQQDNQLVVLYKKQLKSPFYLETPVTASKMHP